MTDNKLTISGITIANGYKYAVQLLFANDEQPYRNKPITISDSCLEWDGSSTINIDDTTGIIAIRVYQYTESNGVQYSGKASI